MKVGGCWKLLYSTITILGSKRTKLGLRDFITLGEFFQIIDIEKVLYTSKSFLCTLNTELLEKCQDGLIYYLLPEFLMHLNTHVLGLI